MKVKTVSVTMRINLGNYNHKEITFIAELDNDCPLSARLELERLCIAEQVLATTPIEEKIVEMETHTLEAAPVVKPKKAKKVVVKYTPYDREVKVHTALFAKFLDSAIPGWKKTHAKQAKAASVFLQGKDFLNESGEIITPFTEALVELVLA